VVSDFLVPGTLATFSGSAPLSWPPDGSRHNKNQIIGHKPNSSSLMLVIAVSHQNGVIVYVESGVWWCPTNSIQFVSSSF